jgi:hypothetical protein
MFTNARWPDRGLRTSSASSSLLAGLWVNTTIDDEFRFSLVMPPLNQSVDEPSFLMYSKTWPDAVVVIVASPVVLGHRRRRHPGMLYVPSRRNIVNDQGASLSLHYLMMQLVVAPETAGDGTPLVMLKHYSQPVHMCHR